jgi:hypothetical protein
MMGAAALPLFAAVSTSALAAGDTIDRMTCQEARDFVARNGRYYISTPAGRIPMVIWSLEQGPSCGRKMSTWMEIHRTLDNSQCFVGWSCNTAG